MSAGAASGPLGPAGTLVTGSAFVTGGGSGIGRAVARALAVAGAPVAVVDVLPEGAEETAAWINGEGGKATVLIADVGRWDDVDRAVAGAVAALGPLGIVVNAAGILDGYTPVDVMTPAVWERVIGVNLTGTFYCSKRALVEMLPRGRGRIINIASVAGLVGSGGGPAYTASKHGVVGLTRQMAIAHSAQGITVNAVCPGVITTGLRKNSARILGADAPPMAGGVGGDDNLMRALTPAGRRGTVEEVAAAVGYLATEAAAYVTGHTLVIDGGWTAK